MEAPGRLEGPQIQQDLTPGPDFDVDRPQRAEFQQDWDPSWRGAPNPAGEGQCRSSAECYELRYPERKRIQDELRFWWRSMKKKGEGRAGVWAGKGLFSWIHYPEKQRKNGIKPSNWNVGTLQGRLGLGLEIPGSWEVSLVMDGVEWDGI